ncbi:hypothetical protein [Falsiphaeobacter marinintestinus]|uniref:hypothetical protein n=1 Tax=Falsiphaeobacter marinintestinus TaxID=1492905 RepID=UPI0011B67169|nr:hypothetical protein [Phaeobacter marinintestinus]
MFLELIGTIFAGIAMAGVVLIVNKVSGGRLPKWATPVGAGLAMIATTISSEYSWYSRNSTTLPEGMAVIQTVENRSFYRPWTYIKPYTERFVALDSASVQTNASLPDQRLADLYFFARWSAVEKLSVLVDCAGNRRAALMDGVNFDAEGGVQNADWVVAPDDDPVVDAVCEVS